MTVVLDTNVVLQARASGHPYHRILQGLLAGRFAMAVSTAIFLEYEEILVARVGVLSFSPWWKPSRDGMATCVTSNPLTTGT
jgi:hypothetical protein